MSLESAHGFAVSLAFACAAIEVGAGLLVAAGTDAGDRVQCVVGLAIPSAGEAVTDDLAGGGRLGCRAVAAGERCLALQAPGVADEQLGR